MIDTNTPAAPVVGRDGYITLKAMLYAIACIQKQPVADRANNDLYDMLNMVRGTAREMSFNEASYDVPVLLCHAMLEVHRHTGQMPDLWPNDFGGDLSEVYEAHDLALMSAVCTTIDAMTKDAAAFLTTLNEVEAGAGLINLHHAQPVGTA